MKTVNIQELLKKFEKSVILSKDEATMLSLFIKFREKYPNNLKASIIFLFGCKASSADQPLLAAQLYQSAIDLGYRSEEVYYNLGNAHMKLEAYDTAIGAYTTALQIKPDFFLAYYNRGLCSYISGNHTDALRDFTQAALLGCDLMPLYGNLASLQLQVGGFESLAGLVELREMPELARNALRSEFEQRLYGVHPLLANNPDCGVEFIENSLQLRAVLADAIIGKALDLYDFERQVNTLFKVAADTCNMNNTELDWRAHYILGLLPYCTYCEQIGVDDRFHRNDRPSIVIFFAFDPNGPKGEIVERLITKMNACIDEPSRIRRFARFAQSCFQRAAKVLSSSLKISGLSESLYIMNYQWYICEDLFRELVRTCLFLEDTSGYFSAVEQARHCYATIGSKACTVGYSASTEAYLELLNKNVGLVNLDEVRKVIGQNGVLLDYYIYEIVEDTISCGAVSSSRCILSEKFVNALCWDKNEPSDLEMFIRTNKQWDKPDYIPTHRYPDRIDEILLGHHQGDLYKYSRMVIVPFNYLHNVPFHALNLIQKLIDSHNIREIVYVPSIKFLLKVVRRTPKHRESLTSLFVGFPSAGISTEAEWEIIKNQFSHTKQLIGVNATVKNVLANIVKYDIIHFCCHGYYDERRNCTYLELADGGLYPAHIVRLLDFAPELIFANACITGVVPRASRNGDQTLGLHTALLFAGARQVIATMWKVDDKAALDFTAHFYSSWLNFPHLSTGEILIQAQNIVKDKYRKLFYWGSHALFGDWK